ncbi:MAG: 2-C-methyl-D-erythritol 4-phosphate cytidylyltransferase [Bacteroidaceae bacterium]|nr:2-C-methyl-D-erythritol 4-phosphate cytidylyltransferase [Bacteroidaceae bacterium]
MNIAIILAAGSGTRLGSSTPKQFLEVCGKTLMEHSIAAFESNGNIDEIAVVTKEEYFPLVEEFKRRNGFRKVKRLLKGGRERYDSSLAAINAYTNDDDCLFLHDCVRACVSQEIIDDCARALQDYDAVDVGAELTDTVVAVDDSGCIADIPVRSMMRNGQTPQCFRRGVIKEAFDIALRDPGFQATDDCGVVHKYMPQVRIYVVKGSQENIKVTYKDDLERMERIIKGRQHA